MIELEAFRNIVLGLAVAVKRGQLDSDIGWEAIIHLEDDNLESRNIDLTDEVRSEMGERADAVRAISITEVRWQEQAIMMTCRIDFGEPDTSAHNAEERLPGIREAIHTVAARYDIDFPPGADGVWNEVDCSLWDVLTEDVVSEFAQQLEQLFPSPPTTEGRENQ